MFRARDTRLGRAVAIKVSNAKFSDRFEREARAISSLNHPHICTLYDVGPNYLVMELVEGTPLKGPLPLSNALRMPDRSATRWTRRIARGSSHRDLKPANILLTKQGVKVLDFGLAHMAAEPGDPNANTSRRRDGHAGVYGSGAVGRQTGRCPVRHLRVGVRAIRDAHRQASFAGLAWPGNAARSIASVVRTCLQKIPTTAGNRQAISSARSRSVRQGRARAAPSARSTGWAWIAATMLVAGAPP